MYTFLKKNRELFQVIVPLVLCMVISLGVALYMMYPGHNWGGDFSQYIAQTRALVNGDIDKWYQKNDFIIENSSDGLGSLIYPWGLSLILTPFYMVFGENIFVFKLVIIAFLSGSVLVSYTFFRRKLPYIPSVLLTLLMALNPTLLASTDCVQSDIPCMFFSLVSMMCIDLHLKSERHHLRNGLLSGLLIFITVQIRTMSLVLLLSLFCVDFLLIVYWLIFLKKGKDSWKLKEYYHLRWYYHIIPYFTYWICSEIFDLLLPKAGETYWDYFSVSIQNIKNMLVNYTFGFREMYGVLFWFFLLLAVVGMVYAFKEEMYSVIYVMGTMAMLLVYHYYQRSRFLFSVYPILLMFSFYGIKFLCSVFPKRIIYALTMIGVVFTIGMYIRQLTKDEIAVRIKINEPIDAYSYDALNVYEYINQNIDDDSVIYFFKPRVLYLNTNVYCYTGDNDASTIDLADYVLFWCNDFQDNIKDVVVNNENFELIFQNNQFTLYKSNL